MKDINEDSLKELKQFILNEISYRKEFRELVAQLNELVDPISKHNRKCYEWWYLNLPETDEIIVIMDNDTTLKITRPKRKECSVETYLPYGIDFQEIKVIPFINIGTENT